MKNLVIGIFCLCSMLVNAQFTKPVNKIQLYSGDVITGENVIYNSPMIKQAVFMVDNDSYESSAVEYFQNNHGYFANLGRIHGFEKERYALRIKTGRINLFEEIEIDVYGGDDLKTEAPGNAQDPMLASGAEYQYYNKGDGKVMEANYRNLKVDLADNAKSVQLLKNFRNYRLLQCTMIGIGSGLIAASVISQTGGPIKFTPFMALGFVVGGGSYLLEGPKSDALWLAGDAYNRTDAGEVLSVNP
jgi:hypothetical protein